MLFKSFSWQDFLLAATVFSLLWYAGVWLLFYRNKKRMPVTPLPHPWQDEVDELGDGLMGRSAPEPGTSVLEAEEFGFGPVSGEQQLGVLPDLQEDIKAACRELESKLGKKEDFLEAFRGIRSRYAVPEGVQDSLNEFIREHVPFFLSDEELDGLWL
ncbi:MAG TPA: hypothetical protein VHA56_22255 [Mucilaginibacter sp.]|nr:hypothetical protein [Mucilaginibacter sp.]